MLYRGGHASPEGLRNLKEMGIQIIIDLRGENRRDRRLTQELGMQYEAIGGHCFHPTNRQFAKFLAIVDNNPGEKIFVGCRLGDDRTGMAVAAFRMANQGWPPEAALAETRANGFNWFRQMICPVLARYERHSPERYASSPVFQKERQLYPPPERIASKQ